MSRSTRWTVFSLLGIGAWLAATGFVAATGDDPSDATPILRTFALAGGGFLTLALLGGAWELWRARAGASERLYRRLAVSPVSPAAVRSAARRTGGIPVAYLAFTAVTSALMFTAIGLGGAGPYRELLLATAGVVGVWLVYSLLARARAYTTGGGLLAPLGLALVDVPTYASAPVTGGGRLVGEQRFAGHRHGRAVSIRHAPRLAVTTVAGRFAERHHTTPAAMAAVTGEPARHWRDVHASAGGAGVAVQRRGNGAGRWFRYDLLAAERLAESASEPADGPATGPDRPAAELRRRGDPHGRS